MFPTKGIWVWKTTLLWNGNVGVCGSPLGNLRAESCEALSTWGVYKRKNMIWQCFKVWWEYLGPQSDNSDQDLSFVGALLLWLGLQWLKWKDIWTDSLYDFQGEWLGECSLACRCSCINTGRLAFEWLIWAVTSWRLTPWDEIETGAELRQRESVATQAGGLLTFCVVVSVLLYLLIKMKA